MVYTSRKRNFRKFIKTHNLKYYAAFLAMVLAVIAAVVVINRNNSRGSLPTESDATADHTESVSGGQTEAETENLRGVYRLCLNLATGRMAAYEWDGEAGKFSDSARRHMLFAAKNIKEGEYKAPYSAASKSTWASSGSAAEAGAGEQFYRYVTDFGDGMVFHSASYGALNDKNSLIADSYMAIGVTAEQNTEGYRASLSPGVTLTVADAKWIYENCSFESEVLVYSDAKEEKPEPANSIISVPEEITWEPTDDSRGTPWCQTRVEEFTAMSELILDVKAPGKFLMLNVRAVDSEGGDVSEYVYITGGFDLEKPGEYGIVYNIIDIFGNHLERAAKLTVKEPETESQTPSETDMETDSESESNTETDSGTDGETDTQEPGVTVPGETDETVSETDTQDNSEPEPSEPESVTDGDTGVEGQGGEKSESSEAISPSA